MMKHRTRIAPTLLFILVSVITAAIYAPGLSGDYVFDDMPNVLNNKRLQMESLSLDSLKGAALSSGSGILRRPVSMASFALNRYFFGTAPYSYKVINLAIHLLTGLGLFLLGRLLFRAYRLCHQPTLAEHTSIWLPVIVSGLWLVHPLNLTSVLYIVQRMTSLSTLFIVGGLYAYVAGRLRLLANGRGLPLILTGLLVFGSLAILSKESGVLLLLYMLAVELTLFRFRDINDRPDRRIIVLFVTFFALPASLMLAYLAMHPEAILAGYSGRDFTLTERLFTEARVVVFYLRLIFIPTISDLGLYHDDIVVSTGLLEPPATLYSILILGSLLLTAFLLRKRYPLISLGILWFFAGHTLESTIYPLEIAHEHRNYLADYGILLAAAAAIAHAPLRRLAPVVHTTAPLLFFILLASTTWLRASQWSDNINQAIYEARHHPASFRAVFAAGRIYGRLAAQGHEESAEKAYIYLEQSSVLKNSGIMPEVTLIKLASILGRPVESEWFDRIFDKLSRGPLIASDVGSLNELVSCIGNVCDIPPDIMESIFSLALKQKNARIISLYGYYTINKRKNFQKGLTLFRQAVEVSPHEPQFQINLIRLLIVMQQPDEADKQLRLFMTANTYGGNERDYRELQESIDELRKSLSQISQAGISGDS